MKNKQKKKFNIWKEFKKFCQFCDLRDDEREQSIYIDELVKNKLVIKRRKRMKQKQDTNK